MRSLCLEHPILEVEDKKLTIIIKRELIFEYNFLRKIVNILLRIVYTQMENYWFFYCITLHALIYVYNYTNIVCSYVFPFFFFFLVK
jgi:hypothetical protein